jgi:DNA-binding PadR family transcriptional regulator
MILGEFEQLVMLAVVHVGDDAYGVSVVDEIESRTAKKVAHAAVYVTMRRLERKGLLESWKGEPTAERGGKARRCVKVTRAGLALLKASRRMSERMWKGLDANVRRSK